jgi:hypothetical protein
VFSTNLRFVFVSNLAGALSPRWSHHELPLLAIGTW